MPTNKQEVNDLEENLPTTSVTKDTQNIDRSLVARWKHEDIFDNGFVPIPERFLELYTKLKPNALSTSEALFVLQVMSFKWSAKAPFPSYARIAERMGVTDKAVRRIAQSLENKGYLKRISRIGTTNKFDFVSLFDALLQAKKKEEKKGKKNNG